VSRSILRAPPVARRRWIKHFVGYYDKHYLNPTRIPARASRLDRISTFLLSFRSLAKAEPKRTHPGEDLSAYLSFSLSLSLSLLRACVMHLTRGYSSSIGDRIERKVEARTCLSRVSENSNEGVKWREVRLRGSSILISFSVLFPVRILLSVGVKGALNAQGYRPEREFAFESHFRG